MSLIERDYMRESYEDRKNAQKKRIREAQQKDELWKLYAKKRKTFIDKKRIKDLEYYNLHNEFPKQKKGFLVSFFKSFIIACIIILIAYILYQFYNVYLYMIY